MCHQTSLCIYTVGPQRLEHTQDLTLSNLYVNLENLFRFPSFEMMS